MGIVFVIIELLFQAVEILMAGVCSHSILELPLQDVPNFIASQDPYEALHKFAGARGLGFIKVDTSNGGILPFAPSTPDTSVICE